MDILITCAKSKENYNFNICDAQSNDMLNSDFHFGFRHYNFLKLII